MNALLGFGNGVLRLSLTSISFYFELNCSGAANRPVFSLQTRMTIWISLSLSLSLSPDCFQSPAPSGSLLHDKSPSVQFSSNLKTPFILKFQYPCPIDFLCTFFHSVYPAHKPSTSYTPVTSVLVHYSSFITSAYLSTSTQSPIHIIIH